MAAADTELFIKAPGLWDFTKKGFERGGKRSKARTDVLTGGKETFFQI